MDFVFGTLATDQLRLLHHSIARTGVQHANDILPRDPLPDQSVTLNVLVGQDMPADFVACYYTTDDSPPSGSRGKAVNGRVIFLEHKNIVWDTPSWTFTTIWQCEMPAQPENTIIRYQISAWQENGDEVYADYPELKATTERAAGAFFRSEPIPDLPPIGTVTGSIFTYHVDTFTPPQWARESVIYHVFVDRFYPGNGREWQQPSDLTGFFGGTLWGVRDKLDYIADLGVDCIWLSPTSISPTHHGYDVTDYLHVEPRMGGDEALHALVEAAHQRGIRVVLDLVANHTSHLHPYFQDALNNPTSPYRDWFTFDESAVGYKAFFDVPDMPTINLNHPEARAWMLDVARHWLQEFDVDGYRLDHANGPGADFWHDFRAACRQVKPDAFCFGEIVEAPNILRTYEGRLDGVLDFHLQDALRKTYAWGTMTEAEFQRFYAHHSAYYGDNIIMPSFLDNHDMERFLYVVKDDKDLLRRAADVQFRLPNPPIIYYGTEVGMSQKRGRADAAGLEESRLPMLWDDQQDKDLLNFYKRLIRDRKTRNHA